MKMIRFGKRMAGTWGFRTLERVMRLGTVGLDQVRDRDQDRVMRLTEDQPVAVVLIVVRIPVTLADLQAVVALPVAVTAPAKTINRAKKIRPRLKKLPKTKQGKRAARLSGRFSRQLRRKKSR